MTFGEFTAEERNILLLPKKSVSTWNTVGQYDWTDNSIMCKTNQTSECFILDQFNHSLQAEASIHSNSIGNQWISSQAIKHCPYLTTNHSTDPNSNIVLKAGIIQNMLSIESNFRNDEVNNDDIMHIAESAQEC